MAHVALILVLLTLCYGVSSRPIPSFECPDRYAENIWFNRAVKICPEDHLTYHCLMVTDITSTARYSEFCQKPERIRKGEYVLYNNIIKTIEHKTCPPGRFQPVERTSNSSMAYQCEKEMTPCNFPGQKVCDDGRPDEDRTCRCKFEDGYILEAFAYGNDDKITCVHPLIITLSCSQLPVNMCSENQEVDRYYQCTEKCPEGYYRPDGGGCYKRPTNMSSTQSLPPSTTFMVTSTTKDNSVDDVMTVDEGGSNGTIVIVISMIVLIVLLISIIAGIYCCKHRKCTHVQNCIGTDNTDLAGDIGRNRSIVCFNFTYHEQEIYVKEVNNLAVGSGAIISDGKISKKKENKKKKDKQEDAEENIALMEGSEEAEVIPNTVDDHGDPSLEQDNADNKGPDSDGCIDRDFPDVDSTIPKEIASNKDPNPDSKVAENSPIPDDDSEVCKETESTKENDNVEKEESSPDCNEYMKDMKLAAKKKGWQVEDVPKDGSCFYHCVLRLYVSKNGWDVSTLRKKLRKYLESNAKLYKDFVTESWENLLRGTENNKWADHVEIKAMAEMLKVPITIHKLNSTGDQLEVKEEIKPKNCHVEPLNIGHILVNKEGFHFVALVPMQLMES